MFVHLPVGEYNVCLRHQRRHVVCHLVDVIDTVVDIINLSAPRQLPVNRLAHHLVVVLHDVGLNRQAVYRRFLQNTHVPDADEAHMQGTWNRRRRQRQNIHIFLEFLDLFLMRHTETLFLVDDQKPQIFKDNILRKDAVRSDHDIHLPFFQIFQRFFLLARRAETRQHIDPDREILHSLHKGIVMLLRQNRGRHQIHDLFALLNRLKRRPERDLCLAISNVAADQAVHDAAAFHIFFCRLDRLQLILRLLKREHFLKLPLPDRIRSILVALAPLASRIKLDEILCNIADRPAHLALRFIPFRSAQFIELRRPGIRSRIFLDSFQARRRKVEIAAITVLNLDVILDNLVLLDLLDAPVNAESVALMHHIITDRKLGKALDLLTLVGGLFLLFPPPSAAEHVSLGNHDELNQRIFKSPVQLSIGHQDFARFHSVFALIRTECAQIVLPQIARQTARARPRTRQQYHTVFFFLPARQIAD